MWMRSRGGSVPGIVAVAAIAGGITGSSMAVVVFMLIALVATLVRRADARATEGPAPWSVRLNWPGK
jgi:hypothetical protein